VSLALSCNTCERPVELTVMLLGAVEWLVTNSTPVRGITSLHDTDVVWVFCEVSDRVISRCYFSEMYFVLILGGDTLTVLNL